MGRRISCLPEVIILLGNSVCPRTDFLIGADIHDLSIACQSPVKLFCFVCVGKTSVESSVVSFDSALRNLCELEKSRELRTEQKDAISTLVSGKDMLAVLPTGFGKSLIFQILVLIKQAMTEKPSSTVAVCPLQSMIYDL